MSLFLYDPKYKNVSILKYYSKVPDLMLCLLYNKIYD